MLELAARSVELPATRSHTDLQGLEAQFVVTQVAAPSAKSIRTAKLLLVLLLGTLFVAVPASTQAHAGQPADASPSVAANA